ncbi:archease [Anaeromyxobacter paludicola]|uniref:Archease n=1 Tax=Anaeromyxobacter paludicola TaxID=2918171 RepID=A0ABM7X9B5_9BACT|nr:archease [Anaeromyxobacter paludicola]BDG08417.1 archease [Anaeromyxobacter paludicola]
MRLELPQPFRDLEHTADVGVAVEGATAEEALARLVLAQAALLLGGAGVTAEWEERLAVEAGGRVAVAVNLLRELLYRFATERLVAQACEVLRMDEGAAEVQVAFGRYDPARHAEGVDLKAVTWHEARFEPGGDGWRAQVVFDI